MDGCVWVGEWVSGCVCVCGWVGEWMCVWVCAAWKYPYMCWLLI